MFLFWILREKKPFLRKAISCLWKYIKLCFFILFPFIFLHFKTKKIFMRFHTLISILFVIIIYILSNNKIKHRGQDGVARYQSKSVGAFPLMGMNAPDWSVLSINNRLQLSGYRESSGCFNHFRQGSKKKPSFELFWVSLSWHHLFIY